MTTETTNYHTAIDILFDEFNDIKRHFKTLSNKEDDLKAVKQPKLFKKEELLEMKLDKTINKSQELILEDMQERDRIESYKNMSEETSKNKLDRELSITREKYESTIAEAKQKYENTLTTALTTLETKESNSKQKYENAINYYKTQTDQMFNNQKRAYEAKKRVLEEKEKNVETEKRFLEGSKTTAEYANYRQMEITARKLIQTANKINNSQTQIVDARIPGNNFTPRPLPKYPDHPLFENAVTSSQLPKLSCPCGRNCPEVPMYPGCPTLTYKCWADEVRVDRINWMREAQEHDKKQSKKAPEEDEDFDETRKAFMMTDEEAFAKRKIDEQIAIQEDEKYEKSLPPLTPFGGLPAPDSRPKYSATNKKPVKTVRSAGILYATPVEIT